MRSFSFAFIVCRVQALIIQTMVKAKENDNEFPYPHAITHTHNKATQKKQQHVAGKTSINPLFTSLCLI
jgi:hypothetical protein